MVKQLIKQFQEATGTTHVDPNSVSFQLEFNDWLNRRKKSGETFLSLTGQQDIDFSSIESAECLKTESDTLINLEKDKTQIIALPGAFGKKYSDRMTEPNISIKTYITHNPYNKNALYDFLEFDDSGKIVLGIFGNDTDHDINNRINELRKIRELLVSRNNNVSLNCVHDKGNIAAVLNTEGRRKELTLRS